MNLWNIRIDTGGTFTDCVASDPEGNVHKLKVLSSGSLRGRIREQIAPDKFIIDPAWEAPDDFIQGFSFKILGEQHEECRVTHFDAADDRLTIDTSLPGSWQEKPFEVHSTEEAPVLASRLITKTLPREPLPPLNMRLATTKGTNALLEHKGTPTLLLLTKGFGDLLLIGDQKRPDLFARQIKKVPPLYQKVLEVEERMDAEGTVLQSIDTEDIKKEVEKFLQQNHASVAICLMHSYKNAEHEQKLHQWLQQLDAPYISVSSELAPFIKIIPRAQTTLVNAYLQPVLDHYLKSVQSVIPDPGNLYIMTSAGGVVRAPSFHPKDSLLSGPAGGVVGASFIGRQAGSDKIISFDMGGTSTDVSRFDNGYDYVFSHSVGDATLNTPSLSIETVAAGGGSVCSFDGQKLTVGPESTGADPGPACYGAGGPLTITDVNLLLGRLEVSNFGIPVTIEAAQRQLDLLLNNIREVTGEQPSAGESLEGFLQIANERMADAIKKISMRKGYDPSRYTLVAFGGAGAQHACALAGQLDMKCILIPSDAGILSAYGLGKARVEQFAEQQLLQTLTTAKPHLDSIIQKLESEAVQKLKEELRFDSDVHIRRRLIYMRLQGQDSTLEISNPDLAHLEDAFREAYLNRYGHWIEDRDIEVESIRIIASTIQKDFISQRERAVSGRPGPIKYTGVQLEGKTYKIPVFKRNDLRYGQTVAGPALILDPYSTIFIEPDWNMKTLSDLTLKLTRMRKAESKQEKNRSKTIALELFTNRFTSIAEEMGEMLQRTALSVNIKERLDFSCALLNAEGELVVNAPHIPVHLGALGVCVRNLKKVISMEPGDVIVTNHPAFGGSHLPDVTVVTPVYTEQKELIGYAASRAHHAEIGGKRPGSMPPDAHRLVEEGVVIPPSHLICGGKEQWGQIEQHLKTAPYPTRAIKENMADLRAAVAANHRGKQALKMLCQAAGLNQVRFYLSEIKHQTAIRMKDRLRQIPDGTHSSEEWLDDGTPLRLSVRKYADTIEFDFKGTGSVHPGNLNATPAIVNSVIMYVLRLLLDYPVPLNEGLLEPTTIHLPNSLLNPHFSDAPELCPAVVGGNTETSQRLTDLILKPFKIIACSQGTMNNVLFGNDLFGYYETIGGGTGAGADFDGADAVHNHMTNTAGTDPEILEQRYPVRLNRYAIRPESGGRGKHRGGNGIIRELTFLNPVSLSVLTQHRNIRPYALKGGEPGAAGRQYIIRQSGQREELNAIDGRELESGDQFVVLTPGGSGYGKP